MGRNPNKVMFLFNVRFTLVPQNMTMDTGFCTWFEDYFLDADSEYAFFSKRAIRSIKNNIPESILLNSEYVFSQHGEKLMVPVKKRFKTIGYEKEYRGLHDVLHFLKQKYSHLHYFTPYSNDPFCKAMDQVYGTDYYHIDEWKDTALFMKRILWDRQNA